MSRAGDSDKTPLAPANGFVTGSATVVQYERDGAWVVVASGAYDLESISPLAEALEIAAKKQPRVVVDASGLSFADSTFLNLLLRIRRLTELRVAAPPRQLLRILEMTGADTVLDVRGTVKDALT
ncbi:STAS domain-containing protein [Streptomyces sp. NPDC007851]|uniref:STAS domain-containing protein n=1 Tax=Streptomyces sp. NPDC007851 TaxID=3155008 RepID=UPI0033FBDDA1